MSMECSPICLYMWVGQNAPFLMAIHFARPHTGGTTQNNPLTTNGPKTQTPPGPVLGVSSGFVGFNAAMFLRAVREKVGLLDQG